MGALGALLCGLGVDAAAAGGGPVPPGLQVLMWSAAYVLSAWDAARASWASAHAGRMAVGALVALAAGGAAVTGAVFGGALLLLVFSFSVVVRDRATERRQRLDVPHAADP